MSNDTMLNNTLDMVVMEGTGIVQSFNTRRLQSDCKEDIRELELQSNVLQSEIEKVVLLLICQRILLHIMIG